MGNLLNSSMVQDNLSKLSIITGSITVGLGTDAALTTNDPSCTLATAAAGVMTLSFGQPFLSAPVITVAAVTAQATDAAYVASVSSVATDGAVLNYDSVSGTTVAVATATGAATTDALHFIAIGLRNR